MSGYTLCIVAGEHSGDLHAGNLVRSFLELSPGSRWFGAGGESMANAGVEILVPMEKLSVVGIGEVLWHLPDLMRSMGTMKRSLRERRPDALVLVDLPDFNFRLARHAHGLGIPSVYYITPQVWAWRSGRTRFLRKIIHRALVILPFEEAFLRDRGVEASFVGHPLLESLPKPCSREEFCSRNGIDPDQPIVGLLPGSRRSEVQRILPGLMGAAERVAAAFPEAAFVVPWAPTLPEGLSRPFSDSRVRFVTHQYHDLLGNADAAAVASGTAVLDAALMEVPQLVVYRLQRITYLIGRSLVRLPHVSLPNIILGETRIPEYIQDRFTPEGVGDALISLLRDPEGSRAEARGLAKEMRDRLGSENASRRAAQALLSTLREFC